MPGKRALRVLLLLSLSLFAVPFAFAQQTGSVSGRVTSTDGEALPGVTVEARSTVLPQPRTTITDETGFYRLPALAPGRYTITYDLAGLQTQTRSVNVLLQQEVTVNASLGIAGVAESITVTADATLIDPQSTEIKSALPDETIDALPVGQEYRDLIKLAPAVQYSEELIRGPSAGGSGQDNVYQFDGVNVTLPLYGTLSAEPSSHDIEQISVLKGGARAVDFVRAAGFTIDSVSKSGTSEWRGQLEYQLQPDAFRGQQTAASLEQFEEDRTWLTANIGGPILRDRLFFYTSLYMPQVQRTDRTNAYGAVPDYDSSRTEYFGKLTFTPISSILLHGSLRDSTRDVENASIGASAAASTALNQEAAQRIAIAEGSWVINNNSFATFKWTDYLNDTTELPNNIVGTAPTTAPGTRLDINALQSLGLIVVPSLHATDTAYNEFITPIIARYGYPTAGGGFSGGGEAGVGSQFNEVDFFRESAQVGYDVTLGLGGMSHDVHVGYQRFTDAEELTRTSNGWGVFRFPRGITFQGTPVGFQAEFTRAVSGGIGGNTIRSEYVSDNVEINDTIRWGNFTFNAGVLVSNDVLYGQGLREDSSTISGYVVAPGNRYKMYTIPWEKQIQPRAGVTWAYNGSDSVYGSYAKYNPSVSSLPRAASWDRNLLGLTTRVHFDTNGNLIGSEQVASSSGKLFVDDLDPRYTDEFMLGTSQQISNAWSARAYARYRYSSNFWEDTNNNARVLWAPEGYSKELYIPNLNEMRTQLGGGSTYVIAELENAYSKYWEATAESDFRAGNMFVRGSYTWSHYYGTFDQDNTTLVNDQAIFVGSSNIADGPGRQIWDMKYGDLRGDRRHLLKLYGTYGLPWNGTIGAFALYQSGQPWEAWDYEPYRNLPGFGTSTSVTNRYAEPAGSRRTPDHYAMDLTYTQTIPVSRLNLQLQVDAFNVLDRQTGYDPQPSRQSSLFGVNRQFFDPRRYQASLRLQF